MSFKMCFKGEYYKSIGPKLKKQPSIVIKNIGISVHRKETHFFLFHVMHESIPQFV